MEWLVENIERGVSQLIARADGPLHFRLLIMPIVVSTIATISGLKDAREGKPAFFWSLLTGSGERKGIVQGLLKDIGRVIIMALVVDTIYQIWQLGTLYPLQAIIVALVCAVMPYVIVRGAVSRIAGFFIRRREPAAAPNGN